MSCTSFRARWEIDGKDDHALECPACGEWVTRQRQAASALARLAASLQDDAGRDRGAELRAAFRRERGRPLVARAARPRWQPLLGLAAAACLVVATALAVGRARLLPQSQQQVGSTAAPATSPGDAPRVAFASPAPSRAPSATPAARARDGGRQPRAVRSAAPRPAGVEPAAAAAAAPQSAPAPPADVTPADPAALAANEPHVEPGTVRPAPAAPEGAAALASQRLTADLADAEDAPAESLTEDGGAATTPGAQRATDERAFRPLLPGTEPVDIEGGQIVRVRLRPEVLDAAGLPPRAGATDPVEAEVLVGPDGVARGIRLAQPNARKPQDRR